MVIDLWGGHLDEARTHLARHHRQCLQFDQDDVLSVCLAVSRPRPADFDRNVSDYWPEFAQNGKQNVKVWHFMNHAAGLSGMDDHMTPEDMYDWNKMVTSLAAQAPVGAGSCLWLPCANPGLSDW